MTWSASELVNFSPATDAPRAVHTQVAQLTTADEGIITSRVLHNLARVTAVTSGYTRARWLDARVIIVPAAALVNSAVVVSCAFGPDNVAPLDVASQNEVPTCTFRTGGGDGVLPPVFTFAVSFQDAGTSELIRPAPVELQRTCMSITFDTAPASDNEIEDGATLFTIFLAGHISVGGTA